MSLRVAAEQQAGIEALEADLRSAAAVIGQSLQAELRRRAPGLLRPPGEAAGAGAPPPDALLVALELDHEREPDALTLSACLAAHRAYVGARGQPEGVSLGALALARLLVWASRAALLGPAPSLAWLGPPNRRPGLEGAQVSLQSRCVCEVDGRRREARAAAIVAPG